jgi:hypothetical protein
MAWFIAILVAIALQVIAYLITPKPKKEKPPAVKDLEEPTVEAGRPVPVLFGTMTLKSPNILWYGDKWARRKKYSP